jgi:membrane-bound lytic murein transglycosylase D
VKPLFLFLVPILFFYGCKTLDYLGAGLEGRDVNLLALYGADKIDTRELDKITIKGFKINDYDNPTVKTFIHGYQTYGRDELIETLERSHIYLPFIWESFKEKGIPSDLSYLPIIESTFNSAAISPASAAGLWQFMYGTAKLYGLDKNYWYDERMDPRRSTDAAAYHLKYLFQLFDDWLLVLAAYNAGQGAVGYAIQKYNTKDFWELCRSNAFSRETRDYIPKFIAATLIAKNPGLYGFPVFDPSKYVNVKNYTVEDSTDLDVIARCSGAPVKQILLLNPSLKQWATPPMVKFVIHLPVDRYDQFVSAFAKIPASDRVTFRRYRVRMGDNLTLISERFGIPINPIAQINRFRSQHFIQAGEDIIIPIRGLELARAIDAKTASEKNKNGSGGKTQKQTYTFLHEVGENESLYDIALRYHVDLSDLFDWNELESARELMKGKLLLVKKEIEVPVANH